MYTAFSHTMGGRKRNLTARPSNEDRVLVRSFDPSQGGPAILAAVADGVSRCADGGAVAQWLIHERLSQDPVSFEAEPDLSRLVGAYLRKVHQDFLGHFSTDIDMMESACTLAGVLVRNDKACVFWSGDSPVHLLRKRDSGLEGQTVTTPDKIEGTPMLTDCFSGLTAFAFRTKIIELSAGDVIVCATDGLALEAKELAKSLNEHRFSREWAERICTDSYNLPGSDDIGVAAIRLD
jgi:serine/threonine protein phosphatase PrpC